MRWLDSQPASQWLVVVGGGKLVDVLRESQRVLRLADESVHWRCIEAMSINAAMLASVFPGARGLAAIEEIDAAPREPSLWFIDPVKLLRHDDAVRSARPLPASWDVTSDSIAARVTELAGGVECVLLKSTLPPAGITLEEASRLNYVDRHLPKLTGSATIRFVDLRDERFREGKPS